MKLTELGLPFELDPAPLLEHRLFLAPLCLSPDPAFFEFAPPELGAAGGLAAVFLALDPLGDVRVVLETWSSGSGLTEEGALNPLSRRGWKGAADMGGLG
jgi:hypothetical protein